MVETMAGHCLCGAVAFKLVPPLRNVTLCHCGQCRRWHGHVGAYSNVKRTQLTFARESEINVSSPRIKMLPVRGHARHASAWSDADMMVWDPEATFVVEPASLLHRHHVTPYAGRTLSGVVHATFVGGQLVHGRV